MLDTPEAVFEALRENHDRPHGLQRTVTAEELAEAAEPFEKPEVLVTALMELMTAYEFTGEHRKAPVVFARLLKLWEDSPGAFSEWEADQILWRFKWVTTSLLQVPEVPTAVIEAWIGRMRERYEADGHGVQPVAAMRYHLAAHTGSGVEDAYDLWATRPRTRLSDCEACETRTHALHRVRSGEDAAALELWAPVLTGASSCAEEPQSSQARALLPLVRLGRTDEARAHHLTGYRAVRGKTGMQQEVGLHLEFCALTRNEGRGLEILAENRPLFEAAGAPLNRLGFLTGVEVLLARLVADGHAGTPVAGPPGRNWTAGELLATVRAEAERLAGAFDARNGTTEQGDRRRTRLERGPLLDEPLPLGLRTAVTRTAAAGTAATGTSSTAPSPNVPAAGAVEVPAGFVELVREARRLDALGHPGDAPLWARIAEAVDAEGHVHDERLGPEGRLRAELAEQRAFGLRVRDLDREACEAMAEAAALFERAGMVWDALTARSMALAWTVRPGSGDEGAGDAGTSGAAAVRAGLEALVREAEALLAAGTGADAAYDVPGADAPVAGTGPGSIAARRYLAVLYAPAYAAFHQAMEEAPEVSAATREWFEAAAGALRSQSVRLSAPHQAAAALEFTANLALRLGETERAERELRAVLEELASGASERPWKGNRPRAVLAQLLIAQGRHDEAVELLHQAIALTVRHGDPAFPLAPAYSMLGHAAAHTGDTAGAVRHFSEAADRFDRDGDHDQAADVRLQLADLLRGTGRAAEAVAVLESVVADAAAGSLDPRLLAQGRLSLARGLRELEEHLAAAEEFLRLADSAAAWGGEGEAVLTSVASEAAVALATADRWDAARAAYARAVATHEQAPNPSVITQMMREFARLNQSARGAEGVEASLAHLAEADAVCAAAPRDAEGFTLWFEHGSIRYRRALVLADAGRFTEALAEAEASVAAHEGGGQHGEEARAEAVRIAALIELNGLDRPEAAAARLAAGAARCEQRGLPEAARILEGIRQDITSARQEG
ncbi:tetratricopeptide repeat protein [Streptomyces katrae]|uniref:tetratricopeptide repeat protein n=1 Tax=Streptomyces katrae TaxID=68223 RepID=UPI0009A4FA75|nr:tetratricopeptide repeat protein [Streptomyces katrae]